MQFNHPLGPAGSTVIKGIGGYGIHALQSRPLKTTILVRDHEYDFSMMYERAMFIVVEANCAMSRICSTLRACLLF